MEQTSTTTYELQSQTIQVGLIQVTLFSINMPLGESGLPSRSQLLACYVGVVVRSTDLDIYDLAARLAATILNAALVTSFSKLTFDFSVYSRIFSYA